jgi:FKBP-type peptidyl-prolyl cis-trans isomerase
MSVTKITTRSGDGTTYPKKGDQLSMHYTGCLMDGGSKFDSCVDRGEPFGFTIGVGQVSQMYPSCFAHFNVRLCRVICVARGAGR